MSTVRDVLIDLFEGAELTREDGEVMTVARQGAEAFADGILNDGAVIVLTPDEYTALQATNLNIEGGKR